MFKVTSDLSGLKKLKENLEGLSGTHQVPLPEVLTADFVSSHSQYADFDALLAAIGVTTTEEFRALPDADFDTFIAANTDFESWLDMQKQGMAEYAKAKLLTGLKG
jgi:hypothetical protein